MNNCPKCGNPLQNGVTSCPICGTTVLSTVNNEQTDNSNNTILVNTVQIPLGNTGPVQIVTAEQAAVEPQIDQSVAASAPTPAPAPVPTPVPTPEPPPAVEQPAPVQPTVPEQNPFTSEPQAQVSEPVQVAQPAPVAPTPVVQPEPVAEQTQVVQATPVVEAAPAAQNAPVAEPVAPVEPVQVQPTSAPAPEANVAQTETIDPKVPLVTDEDPKKGKKAKKKMPLLILGVVGIAAIAIVAVFFLQGSTPTPGNKKLAVETSAVATNGYKFNMEKDWAVIEDSSNVVITNPDETVIIKLDHTTSNINTISESLINSFLSAHEEYGKTSVSQTKISAKDAYLVSATIQTMPVQIYFINGGSNLLLGVTIVYQNDEAKTKCEASVTELVESISYADDSSKAISTLSKYSEIFNSYNGILNHYVPPVVDDQNQDENNFENDPENGEDPAPENEEHNGTEDENNQDN